MGSPCLTGKRTAQREQTRVLLVASQRGLARGVERAAEKSEKRVVHGEPVEAKKPPVDCSTGGLYIFASW